MVVVAIVGILSAVGLPELTKAQNKGKDAAALATVTNAAKECALNLIIETPTAATTAHTAAIANGGKFQGVTGVCTIGEDPILMTLTSPGNPLNSARITFVGGTPGPAEIVLTEDLD
jgi:type II secretory pathway pseudopilin PulG